MIYVITHKVFDDSIITDKNYRILHVGNNNNCKNDYLRDDIGDNISYKNPYYCELTGLYWLWKNADEKANEVLGLVHYRRFFTYQTDDILYTYLGRRPRILTTENITKDLVSNDVILPKPEKIFRTVSEFYEDHHNPEDLIIVRKVVAELYPEYINSFDRVMKKHYFYFGNMIIAKRKIIDQYCEWLFNIMKEVEKYIVGYKIMDSYQSRVYGFISERLIQVWVEYNDLRIKTYPVFNVEKKRMNIIQKNFNRVKHFFKSQK